MKVGDLVMVKTHPKGGLKRTGVVVEIIQKKCWRTHKMGKKINWDLIDPEPHGVVMFDDLIRTIPEADLRVFEA